MTLPAESKLLSDYTLEQVGLLKGNSGFLAVLDMIDDQLRQTLDEIQVTTDPKEAFRLLRHWQSARAFTDKLRQAPDEILEVMKQQQVVQSHEQAFLAQWGERDVTQW